MPFFGRQGILAKTAAAAAGSANPFFQSTGTAGATPTNNAGITLDRGSGTNWTPFDRIFTFSCWFRAEDSDLDTRNFDQTVSRLWAIYGSGDNGAQIQLYGAGDNTMNMAIGRTGQGTYFYNLFGFQNANLTTDLTDNVWHHVYAVVNATATNTAVVYLDGVQMTGNQGPVVPASGFGSSISYSFRRGSMFYWQVSDTPTDNDGLEYTGEMAYMWVDNTARAHATEVPLMRNSSTGAYIAPGTTGTFGGTVTQPAFFIYVDSNGALASGGATSFTPETYVLNGTGSITKNLTGGPA